MPRVAASLKPPKRQIVIDYAPRKLQQHLHDVLDSHRWVVAVCHRRFGKTVLAVNHLQKAALTCRKERPRFYYVAPTFAQGKSIAWDYFKHYSAVIPGVEKNESELRINYPNGAQVQILGADNPDRMRGIYADGVVFDEYGLQPPNVFSEVMRPALSDRQGWALFVGTPNGRNQFQKAAQEAQVNVSGDWAFVSYKASETGYVEKQELLNARTMMTHDEYQQEYECSFEAAIKGAIYSVELQMARDAGRICRVPWEPTLPVDTAWDIGGAGGGDSTAIWFCQSTRSGEVRLIDYHEATGEGLPYYANVLRSKPFVYGRHRAPHDIQVTEFASGRSRWEVGLSLGIRFEACPNVPLEDGIHAVRMLFNQCWFDETKCRPGLDALQAYRRDYNTRLNEFKAVPVHDWASHCCLVAGSMVTTEHGAVPIESVSVGMRVWTPRGWSNVLCAGEVGRVNGLMDVILADGRVLTCTPEHKVLTQNGFVVADALRYNDRVFSGREWIIRLSSLISRVADIGYRASITGEMSGLSLDRRTFIGRCGNRLMGQFQRVMTCTMSMGTRLTMPLRTWSAWSGVGIEAPIRESALPTESYSRRLVRPWSEPPSGIGAMRVGNGTLDTGNGPGTVVRGWRARVRTAVSRFNRRILRAPSGATRIVKLRRYGSAEGPIPVYDLTVESHGCYRANGMLVSNSDAFRYLAVSQSAPVEKRASSAPPAMSGQWW